MWRVVPILLVATPALADAPPPGKRVIECYCTDTSGARVEMGEIICLTVGGRMFTAQCQMSVNMPMWRELNAGCESSTLRGGQSFKPAADAGAVHPHI